MATIGQPLTAPENGWKRIDNTDSNISYMGSWTYSTTSTGSYSSTIAITSTKNDSLSFSFKGTKLRILARRYTSGHSNNINVYIDNVLSGNFSVTGVDTHQCLFYEVTNLTNGYHSVKIENAPTSGSYFHFDAIDIADNGKMGGPINKFLILTSDGSYKSIKQDKETNLIPKMTSNITPSGVASASSIQDDRYPAWKAFNGVSDTTAANSWISQTNYATGWLRYDFEKAMDVVKYSVSSSYQSFLNHAPKDWTFEGSDDGKTWIVLDTQINQTGWSANEYRHFNVPLNTNYSKYRLNIIATNGANYIAVGEFQIHRERYDGLIELRFGTEEDFIYYGIDPLLETELSEIDLNRTIKNKIRYVQETVGVGSGRVFKQTIDTSKVPIKNVSIE
ncbi:MAG: discoidin domain-containing protein [Bacillota bacterium]